VETLIGKHIAGLQLFLPFKISCSNMEKVDRPVLKKECGSDPELFLKNVYHSYSY
jgi:hypothetical protein